MNTNSVAHALNAVRPFLFDFLVEHEVIQTDNPTTKDSFVCPNPNHEDTAPSANIVGGALKGYCHGCKSTFDILHLNHWLNGAPISGFGFISNNLMPLCEKYDVIFELGDLSEEEKFKLDSYRVCGMVYDYITSQLWSDDLTSYVQSRGLNVEFCRTQLSMGVVPNYDSLYNHLRDVFSAVFLREVGLEKKSMFSPTSIIFTIKDAGGTPVGFISRDIAHTSKMTAWEENGRVGRPPIKYDSSPERNRIFFKRQILFGLDRVLQLGHEDLYVFEGQFDWATAISSGLDNSIALSGSVFTPEHISLLRRSGIKTINLVLDSDKAGNAALRRMLFGEGSNPGMLTTTTFLKVNVITLPEDQDPSDFLVSEGLQSFLTLPVRTAFQWALEQQNQGSSPVKITEDMLPFILAEPSYIIRETMIQILSDETGISIKSISDEITRREDAANASVEKEQEAIVDEALREARYGEGNRAQILRNALDRIESIELVSNIDVLSSRETLIALNEQIEKEASIVGPQGFKYGKLSHFQQDLNGECEGVVLAFGGVPNTGKTALQSQLAKELVEFNEDAIVIVHTIDDTRAQFNRRLVVQWAQEEAERRGLMLSEGITLNKIANPQFWEEAYPVENEGLSSCREFGYNKLKQYLKEERLHIKDTTHGPTLVLLERLVKKVVKDHPGARVVVVLDNFHKTQDYNHLDERSSVKRRSQYLKTNIAQGFGIAAFSTFEYKKVETGKRPTNNDLRDAVNIEYDINYLMNLFNPLKAANDTGDGDKCEYWHGNEYSKLPIIEGATGKNKITDFTETRHFKFYPAQSRYECLTTHELSAIVSANRSLRAESKGHRGEWVGGSYHPNIPQEKSRIDVLTEGIPF